MVSLPSPGGGGGRADELDSLAPFSVAFSNDPLVLFSEVLFSEVLFSEVLLAGPSAFGPSGLGPSGLGSSGLGSSSRDPF